MSRKLTLSTKPKPRQANACGQLAGRAYFHPVSQYSNPFRRSDPRWHEWLAGWRIGRNHR